MRRALVASWEVSALLVAGCVRDVAGPGAYRASLSVAPLFERAAPVVAFDRVRVTLARSTAAPTTAATLALDTLVPFPATADTLELDLVVILRQVTETFVLEIALIDAVGDTVYRAGPISVTLTAGLRGQPVTPTFRFTGSAPIVFAGDSAGGLSSGVFRVNPDGTNRVKLDSRGSSGDVHPRLSPDRRRAAYTASSITNPTNALFVAPITADTAPATVVSDTSTRRPRWSSDGVHLAFECGDGFSAAQDVCVIPDVTGPISSLDRAGDGKGKLFVTDFDPAKVNGPGSFAWDPTDPSRLAVIRDSLTLEQKVASRIWTVGFDGSAPQPLSAPTMDLGGGPLQVGGTIDWSPDGTTLVFVAIDTIPNSGQNLYVINRDGSGLRKLTLGQDADTRPVFSPDGRRVLFLRNSAPSFCSIDYWTANADGSGEQQLSDEMFCGLNTFILGHDWSPGGGDIVLVGSDPGGFGSFLVYTVPATTTSTTYRSDRRLVGRGVDLGSFVSDFQPNWRP